MEFKSRQSAAPKPQPGQVLIFNAFYTQAHTLYTLHLPHTHAHLSCNNESKKQPHRTQPSSSDFALAGNKDFIAFL